MLLKTVSLLLLTPCGQGWPSKLHRAKIKAPVSVERVIRVMGRESFNTPETVSVCTLGEKGELPPSAFSGVGEVCANDRGPRSENGVCKQVQVLWSWNGGKQERERER